VEQAFRTAEDLKRKLPHIHLLMTSADNSPQTILRALRSGAEEFLAQPLNWPEALQCLERMQQKIVLHQANGRDQGSIITIFSSKGGVGSTTVATNLAVALTAARQHSVCIVDLVLQFGAVTSFLNLEASYTILDLVKNLQRIDALFLEGSLVKHASGVRVLAEPFHVEEASRITPADIEATLDVLVQSFDFVVVDTPKEIDEMVFPALQRAHLILFVMEMNIPSLKGAHRALDSFERLGIPAHKVRLIVNRHVSSKLMSLESVEKTLGTKIFSLLPNDYPTAIAALNQGVPILDIDPRSKLTKKYRALAEALREELSVTAGRVVVGEDKKPGLLSRWLSPRSAR
jgi:pilus assembly protein CpaE